MRRRGLTRVRSTRGSEMHPTARRITIDQYGAIGPRTLTSPDRRTDIDGDESTTIAGGCPRSSWKGTIQGFRFQAD